MAILRFPTQMSECSFFFIATKLFLVGAANRCHASAVSYLCFKTSASQSATGAGEIKLVEAKHVAQGGRG